MGNCQAKGPDDAATNQPQRVFAITGGANKGRGTLPKLPQNTVKANPDDYAFLEVRVTHVFRLSRQVVFATVRSPSTQRLCHCVHNLQGALAKLLLFNRLDASIQRKLVTEMFERNVSAGEILIKEGDTGLAATELYVVKSGKFEVRPCT